MLPERNPHKAIYSSSPDRGLWTAVECWPEIRKHVPDAELHVFYGFDGWYAAHAAGVPLPGNPHEVEALCKATPGVVLRGRVDQKTLAREFLSAGVWAYPTWFSETSCITAMEAQAAGLRIVTSPIAALNETVGDRGVMIPGDWRSSEYKGSFSAAVTMSMIGAATGNGATSDILIKGFYDPPTREQLQQYARDHFSIDTLASDWDRMLAELMTDAWPRFFWRDVA